MTTKCALALIALVAVTWHAAANEPKLAKAVNLEKLNTEADEDDPFVAADGNMYFASNRAGNWQIMVAKRASGGSFGPGKTYLSSKDADYRCPFVFRGILYFAHNSAPAENTELKNFDIVKKTGKRQPLPLLGISEKDDELHPWITTAGTEFYFSRKLADGWTQFVAIGPIPGPIGKAKQVGFPAGFHHATLSRSGLAMYLQGPLEDGRIGIFRSKRTKLGAAWSMPEPVRRLNHPKTKFGDMSPSLSADGNRLYFVSDRPGGKGGRDIWMVLTRDLK